MTLFLKTASGWKNWTSFFWQEMTNYSRQPVSVSFFLYGSIKLMAFKFFIITNIQSYVELFYSRNKLKKIQTVIFTVTFWIRITSVLKKILFNRQTNWIPIPISFNLSQVKFKNRVFINFMQSLIILFFLLDGEPSEVSP